jgi:prophage regulatory protein
MTVLQTANALPGQMLRMPAVISLTGLSRSTIYRLIDSGEFPRGVKLTRHTTAWPATEVADWIQSRIAARKSG